ncbi:MAG: exodeoxyribonuclease VII small subunit [Spirochaetes bacterium]|nr:exodeoxyribonuclease VII small subunit [Spirochaetota bacterium]NMB65828.1 exodeoxyribonuclease VII small subunit [Spirochaetota bacterium]HOJ27974.1 exodeoxyribonuclease VII small subunit [Spirochaetota bacterium]HOM09022.1 exodeoxyribonuclease VII small subunit [Spirochaetota bacterium]HPP48848.1 exodeoxyribonuclease VII small subunit [Spirochaetota bacterium]
MEKKAKKITFEDALEELEAIASKLESGELTLEQSIQYYERGVELAKFCRQKLEEAERKIEVLQKQPDGTVQKKSVKVKEDTGEIEDDEDIQGSLL